METITEEPTEASMDDLNDEPTAPTSGLPPLPPLPSNDECFHELDSISAAVNNIRAILQARGIDYRTRLPIEGG